MEVPVLEIKENFDLWLKGQQEVVMRVRHYTYKCFARYRWRINLEGLVVGAFMDVYEGRRNLPPDKNRVACMCKIVKSKVSNWLVKEKRHQSLEDISDKHYSNDPTSLNLLRCEIQELVKGDSELEKMVEILIQDPEMKRPDIALMMDTSIEKVASAYKRLARRILKGRNH